jgi:NodT family efflux transporter outer membrane factor (OMF) lipoprotein
MRPPPLSIALGLPAALLALSGCATALPTTPTTSVVLPAEWSRSVVASEPLDTAALAQWWHRFDDPVLSDLVSAALARNPDIRTAVSRITEARAVRDSQKSSLLPSLSADLSGGGNRTRARRSGTTTSSESYGASLDASWEIDLFGRQRQTLSAASADLGQARENLHSAQVTLAAEVAAAYVALRSAETRLAVVRSTIETRAQTLQIAEWRENAGTGDALDRQQAVGSLEQARASVPELRQTIAQTRNQLVVLLDLAPGALDTLLQINLPLPRVPPAFATGIPAETLRQRPDVRASEYALLAAAARTSAARRERLPTLNLSGTIGVEALKAGDLLDPETIVASALGSLTAPVFDAGRIRNNITIQSEREQQALIAYESTVLTALAEVENALVAVSRNAERLSHLQRAAAAAREAESLALLQYQAGQSDLLAVLDAQRSLLSFEEQVVATRADELSAHIQLYKALGGGWAPAAVSPDL